MNKLKLFFVLSLVVLALFLIGCSDYSKGQVCGTHTETYTTSAKGCDGMSNCKCLHQSWAGLGSCDSCECTKEVSNC